MVGKSMKLLLTAVVVAMVVMWVWIYVWAPRTNPDRLENRSFTAAAQAICEPIQAALEALPTGRDVTTAPARTSQIVAGTTLASEMVARLKGAVNSNELSFEDSRLLDAWFDDWDAYLKDRKAHESKLIALGVNATDEDFRFILTERAEGGIYTTRIDGFANVNEMQACHTPGDL